MANKDNSPSKEGLLGKLSIPPHYVSLSCLVRDMGIKYSKAGDATKYISKLIRSGKLSLNEECIPNSNGYRLNPTQEVKSILESELRKANLFDVYAGPAQHHGFSREECERIMKYPAVDPVEYLKDLIKQKYGS